MSNDKEIRQTPYFDERKPNECIVLVTESFDEFGEIQITRRHLSEKTANRLLKELTKAIRQTSN